MARVFDAQFEWGRVCKLLDHNHLNVSWLFKRLDSTSNGYFSWVDVQNILPSIIHFQDPLTDEQAKQMIDFCDADSDGVLTMRELSRKLAELRNQRRPATARLAADDAWRIGPEITAVPTPARTPRAEVPAKAAPFECWRAPTPPERPAPVAAPVGTPRTPVVPRKDVLSRSPSKEPKKQPKKQEDVDVDSLLKDIVGQEQIKDQVRAFKKSLALDKKRQELGNVLHQLKPPHMAFMGNPGTGKTTIARLLAQVLRQLGFLSKGHLVEVQRSELVAGAIGQTGPMTQKKIEEARGGVLFIDEAYRLTSSKSEKDFGYEALDQLMQCMNHGDTVLIFAGYEKEMKTFIDANPGLYRRIQKQFHFNDYTALEMAKMFFVELEKMGFKLDEPADENPHEEQLMEMIEAHTYPQQRERMNGGLVQQMIQLAKESLDTRLDPDAEDIDKHICSFKKADIEYALTTMKQKWVNYGGLGGPSSSQPPTTSLQRLKEYGYTDAARNEQLLNKYGDFMRVLEELSLIRK